MGRKEESGANFSHAAGRAGAFFTGDWIAERMRTPFILPILLTCAIRVLRLFGTPGTGIGRFNPLIQWQNRLLLAARLFYSQRRTTRRHREADGRLENLHIQWIRSPNWVFDTAPTRLRMASVPSTTTT